MLNQNSQSLLVDPFEIKLNMNDNNNKKQRKFYTNCPLPECKEKITVSIDSSEERIERKAEERLEEELVKH
jgi:hypothetical protein